MKFIPPTPEQVRAFLARHELSGSRAAELAGLHGGQSIRKYTGGQEPRQMSYPVWFTLHAKAVLTEDEIARVEAAMRESEV